MQVTKTLDKTRFIVRSDLRPTLLIKTWGVADSGSVYIGRAAEGETDTAFGGEVGIDIARDYDGKVSMFMSVPSMGGDRFEVAERAYIVEVALRVADVLGQLIGAYNLLGSKDDEGVARIVSGLQGSLRSYGL